MPYEAAVVDMKLSSKGDCFGLQARNIVTNLTYAANERGNRCSLFVVRHFTRHPFDSTHLSSCSLAAHDGNDFSYATTHDAVQDAGSCNVMNCVVMV